MGKFIDRTGEERIMNCGMKAKIIKYNNGDDIDVRFENGIISYNKTYQSFKKGNIKYNHNKIGEIRIMNCGMKAEIIEYRNCNDIDIKFEDGYIKKRISYKHFLEENVSHPFIPTLLNVGYIGETNTSDGSGKLLKSYKCWSGMIQRCYDPKQHIKHPTYKDCEVCEEWKCYANFKKWYDENIYEIEGERMHLDKDILIKGNKIYSPDTCVFVPQCINSLFTKCNSKRGNLPIGVTLHNHKYRASLSTSEGRITSKVYDTKEEAFLVYKEIKEKEIKRVADLYKDKIPQKLYDAMYNYEVEITD